MGLNPGNLFKSSLLSTRGQHFDGICMTMNNMNVYDQSKTFTTELSLMYFNIVKVVIYDSYS